MGVPYDNAVLVRHQLHEAGIPSSPRGPIAVEYSRVRRGVALCVKLQSTSYSVAGHKQEADCRVFHAGIIFLLGNQRRLHIAVLIPNGEVRLA